MKQHILTERINERVKQGRTAVIPFLTAGFPDLESFWTHLEGLDKGGADVIEIGVPFSDPVADGPVVEAASQKALANGVTLRWILEGLRQRKGTYSSQLVFMGYYNPFLQYGLEKFAREASEAGVVGWVVPDLPHGEDEPMRSALSECGMALVPLVGVNTRLQRLQKYA